jgi:hypothetical protein
VDELYTTRNHHEVRDFGEVIDTPGRRTFGYSQNEIEEALNGRDNLRLETIYPDSPAFGYNESFKNKYPADLYLKSKETAQYTKIVDQTNEELRDRSGVMNYHTGLD